MKKNLFILAALLLPVSLCAQSALQQLESMAGMSIHDVKVPDPGDPVPVDPDPEEESQPKQSTHLKDYTPAQETTEPAPEPKPKTAEELWQEEWKQHTERERAYNKMYSDAQDKYYDHIEERKERVKERYEWLMHDRPTVRAVPQFSSIGERSYHFDHPLSIQELKDSWATFILDKEDTLYRADYMRYVQPGGNALQPSTVRFLGTRLANGRVEWRMFNEKFNTRDPHRTLTVYQEWESLSTAPHIKAQDILDIKMAAEGRVMILEMKNGNKVVIRPNGDFLCEGRNISFPAMISEGVFVECDGKLYSSTAPRYSAPLLEGDNFQYFTRTLIVQNHDANNQPYYRLATYGGTCYDIKKHQWNRNRDNDQYSYLSCFTNQGDYFIAQPKGKNYYVILANCNGLYKGKKTYKTIEAAHAAWPKERAYIVDTSNRHPEQCAKIK